MSVESVKWSEVAQSCPTLCDSMDCSLPGCSVHGIFQARIQEWVAIYFSRRCSWPRNWTGVSHTVGRPTVWATREVGDAIQASHRLFPPFSCPQSRPTSGSFPVSQLFPSGGQSTGTSASASVLPVNIQAWFPLGLTGLISLQSKDHSSLLQHHNSKVPILQHSVFFMVQLSHPYMITGKTIGLTIQTFVSKEISLLFFL